MSEELGTTRETEYLAVWALTREGHEFKPGNVSKRHELLTCNPPLALYFELVKNLLILPGLFLLNSACKLQSNMR